jgi:dimethylglycine dehydrogenase
VRPEYQRALYDLLLNKGEPFGLTHFGMRALLCMRLEKSFGTWFREYRPIYGPYEAGLGRFVDLKKNDFIGRDAAAREKESGGKFRLQAFVVDALDADAIGDEPIWRDGKVVGWVTSGGYGHSVGKSLAMGYITKELARADDGFEIEIIGERRPATRLDAPIFDPQGLRMRG